MGIGNIGAELVLRMLACLVATRMSPPSPTATIHLLYAESILVVHVYQVAPVAMFRRKMVFRGSQNTVDELARLNLNRLILRSTGPDPFRIERSISAYWALLQGPSTFDAKLLGYLPVM